MTHNYWADSDQYICRLPDGASICGPAESFRYDTLQWAPCGRISNEIDHGDMEQVSEAEADRICDLIRERSATERATAR